MAPDLAERAHGEAQVFRRKFGHVSAGSGAEAVEMPEAALQGIAMPCAGDQGIASAEAFLGLRPEGIEKGRQARAGAGRHREARPCSSRQVGLGEHGEGRGRAEIGGASPRRHQRQDEVRFRNPGPAPAYALGFHRFLGLPQAGRIDENNGQAIEVEADLDGVAGRAGDVGHDGRLPPGQGIEEGRLAGIGLARQHDPEPFPQALPPSAVGQGRGDGLPQCGGPAEHRRIEARLVHIPLIREIEGRLRRREAIDRLVPPGRNLTAQGSFELAEGLPPLALGLGVDQVGDGLGLGEIHPPVEQGSPGELAGSGGAAAGMGRQHGEDAAAHREPSVQVKLGHVFAAVGSRAGEEGHERPVEHRSVHRIPQGPQGQAPRRGEGASQGFEDGARGRAADADHRDGGPAEAAGRGEKCLCAGLAHPVLPLARREWRAPYHGRRHGTALSARQGFDPRPWDETKPMPTATRRAFCGGLLTASLCRPTFVAAAPEERLRAIEAGTGGRLGVCVKGQGITPLAWRADERFPLCSTFKVLSTAAVLARVDAGSERLDRVLPLREDDLLSYAPVARKAHAAGRGLTVAEACAAAIQWSDNTAANLQFALLGGPEALTQWVRGTGDTVTRLDRTEPSLNTAIPGDPRDTTSPAAMRDSLERILLGDILTPGSRGRLRGWMEGAQTGFKRLRAGLPADWDVGDKTGSGDGGTFNVVAIIQPPGRPPLLAAVYLTGATASPEACEAAQREVGRLIAEQAAR